MQESLIWFEKGVNLFESKKYSGAIAAFDKALKNNPALCEAWNNRGLCLIRMGQYQEAISSFDKTLALNPSHENAKKARSIAVDLLADGKVTGTVPVPAGQPPVTSPARPAFRDSAPVLAIGPIRNPWFAGIFSLVIPGWGQWYNGRRWDGLKFFGLFILASVAGFFTLQHLIGGISPYIIHLAVGAYSMSDAYRMAKTINRGELPFARKSRLFWVPALVLTLPAITIILAVMAAVFFGIAAQGTHTPVIAAIAQQTSADTIVIQYVGGQDGATVTQVTATVTDSKGKKQVKTIGPSGKNPAVDIPSSISFTGEFSGKDHVLVEAVLRDGRKSVIFNQYV